MCLIFFFLVCDDCIVRGEGFLCIGHFYWGSAYEIDGFVNGHTPFGCDVAYTCAAQGCQMAA